MKKLLCLLLLMLCWIPLLAHAENSFFTVTDVARKNDDGTSRQEILAELFSTYGAYKEIPVSFQTESRPGGTDIFILADGAIIGKFSSEDILDVMSCITAKNTPTVKIGVSGERYFAYVHFYDALQWLKLLAFLILSLLLVLIIPIVLSILWCKRHPGPHPALRRAWLLLLCATLIGTINTSIQEFGHIRLGGIPAVLIAAFCFFLCSRLDHWLDARATKKCNPPT